MLRRIKETNEYSHFAGNITQPQFEQHVLCYRNTSSVPILSPVEYTE
jgi:hypothetical protein